MSTWNIILWILSGIPVTLSITAISEILALLLAFVCGVLQYLTTGVTRTLISWAIDFWRSSQILIMLFFLYYLLPNLNVELSAFAVSVIVLSLVHGAYGSQAVRGALQSINKGQLEAARALGLKRQHTFCLIEFPQALPRMAPTLGNELIELVKATVTVSFVGVAEIAFRAQEVMQINYRPALIYTVLILIYVALLFPVSFCIRRRLEKGRAGIR